MKTRLCLMGKWTLRSTIVGASLLAWCWYSLPEPPPLAPPGYSQRVFARDGSLLRITLSADDKYRVFTPLAAISKELVTATLAHEDRYFFRHPGVNPLASVRAAADLLRGHRGGGASTITMQLARVRYGLRTRTVRGKLLQMYRALQIERHHSKHQILEHYLNLAPYGGNIEGAGAASLIYFGKPAARLARHEALALSVIPQSPARRALAPDTPNSYVAQAQRRVARKVSGDSALSEGFEPRARARLTLTAPHLVHRVLSEFPTQREITCSIHPEIQALVERQINAHLVRQKQLGVSNAAALLVDFRDMEVLAQCGSANFFDESISGQVDGTRSRRSPGSTLKPFIYALAIDQGIIHPRSILKDTPQSFGGYDPENFEGDFSGPITAADSLARSRNVPAVWLASHLTRPGLYDWLLSAGVRLQRESSHYGLALPLGGGEVTMEELVRLYAMLANGGRLRQLQRTLPSVRDPGSRVLSPEAAFLALQMIGNVPRPDIGQPAGATGVYWKTGTSHGFRDAWSVAVFDHYVLAVWLGNFDGSRNPALVGRTCAAPLLFQVIDAMRARGLARPVPLTLPRGINLREVEFCAVSGELPCDLCPHRAKGWFVPGVSPIATCGVHREVLIDTDTGLRVARDDGTRRLRRETYEFWPSDLLELFARAGLPRRSPPPFLPGESSAVDAIARRGRAPEIVSPTPGQTYAVTAGGTIELRALSDSDAEKLYWFVDRQYLGASLPGQTLAWHASPGVYRITALDHSGRMGTSKVSVEAAQAR